MASMTWNDYRAQVKQDALDATEDLMDQIIDQNEHTISVQELVDTLWVDDSVTGNASGSYTMDRARAQKYIAEVVWSAEFADAMQDWGMNASDLEKQGPEAIDVTIRCYVLGEVAQEVAESIASRHGLTIID